VCFHLQKQGTILVCMKKIFRDLVLFVVTNLGNLPFKKLFFCERISDA